MEVLFFLMRFTNLKIWWHDATLFDYFDIIYYIHSIHHIQTVHSSIVIRRSSSPSPPCFAEPRIELGPALQIYQLSYATP
jgi:hypothetical protein